MKEFRIWLLTVFGFAIAFVIGLRLGADYSLLCQSDTPRTLFCDIIAFMTGL